MFLSQLFIQSWLLFLLAFPPTEHKTITSAEAKASVGEVVKVCGVVSGVYEPKRSKRNPTIINFDQPYPNNSFAAVIWKKDREQFGNLKPLINQRVCVTGEVYLYRERANVKLTTNAQLAL